VSTHLPVLPEMRCDIGCELCCSEPVPIPEAELVRVLAWANERDILPQVERPHMCVWFQGGRCAVHEARPLICAAFGYIDAPSLTCQMGYNENLPDPSVLTSRIAENGPPVRYLHEVLDAGMTDPEQALWRARIQQHVWDGVNANRENQGLPALKRKFRSTSEGRIVAS
jgi:hypothetical protein